MQGYYNVLTYYFLFKDDVLLNFLKTGYQPGAFEKNDPKLRRVPTSDCFRGKYWAFS